MNSLFASKCRSLYALHSERHHASVILSVELKGIKQWTFVVLLVMHNQARFVPHP